MCGYFILYPKSNIRNDILDLFLNIKKNTYFKTILSWHFIIFSIYTG